MSVVGGGLGAAPLMSAPCSSVVVAPSAAGSAVTSLDFAGGRTSGNRPLVGPVTLVSLAVRWLGGGTGAASLEAGAAGVIRGFVVRDGRPIGGFFLPSIASFGAAIAARDAAIDALLGGGGFIGAEPGTLRGAASSGRTAGMRVVESMRVGGKSSAASASE